MSDRTTATVTLGGRLPSSALPEFCKIARIQDETEGLIERDDGLWCPDGSGVPAVLTSHDVKYGGADLEKAFACEHGLVYVHHADATDEYGPTLSWWDAEAGEERTVAADTEANPTFTADELRAAMEGRSSAGVRGAIQSMIAKQSPPEVPPLVVEPEVGDRVRWTETPAGGGEPVTFEGRVDHVNEPQGEPDPRRRAGVRSDEGLRRSLRLDELTWLPPEPSPRTAADAAVAGIRPLSASPFERWSACGPDDNPLGRLLASTRIGGVDFHVEAVEVTVSKLSGNEQVCVLPDEHHHGELALQIVGGAAETIELVPGREYVLFITPHAD